MDNYAWPKKITVKSISGPKKNQKGKEFISVNDGSDWWYLDNSKLFHFFKKGLTVAVLVDTKNNFKKITDVVLDEKVDEGESMGEPIENREDLKWEKIREQKHDDISWMNAKNVAATLLSAAVMAKEIKYEDALIAYPEMVKNIDEIKRK